MRLPLLDFGFRLTSGRLDLGLPTASKAPDDRTSLSDPTQIPKSQIQNPKRVLVVDDNADSAESLAELVNLWDYETQIATNGPSALKAAESYRPDAVLLDIGMPGLDGYEVARQLRRQPGLAHIRLVAMTGYGREEDREQAREAGFDHHLTKPVNPDELERLLVTLFSGEPGEKESRTGLS